MFQADGKKVVLGAADTFRAAAVEQLTIWAERLGAEIVTGPPGSDPASVAHRAVARALEIGADVCIVDTAGRLQTQQNLMQQLTKIHRVLGKQIPEAPHEVLLVLDATTGQNGISQAKHFTDAVHCTGIVLAKLDGTAKGGVVVAIRKQVGLPVKYIGVGEKAEDLALFEPDPFVDALFEDLSAPADRLTPTGLRAVDTCRLANRAGGDFPRASDCRPDCCSVTRNRRRSYPAQMLAAVRFRYSRSSFRARRSRGRCARFCSHFGSIRFRELADSTHCGADVETRRLSRIGPALQPTPT